MRQRKKRGGGKPTEKIDYNRYRMSARELLLAALAGALAGLAVTWICYNSWRALPIVVPSVFLAVRIRRDQLCRRRKDCLLAHFRELISSLYSNLAAGYSLENSLRSAAQDMHTLYGSRDVLVQELDEICRGMSLQIPVERLLYDLGERSGLEDVHCFGEVLMIVKRTGGNLDKAIKESRRTICERIDTRREIDTIVAAKRYEQRVMSMMPAGIILYLRLSFRGFLDPLYGNPAGVCIMTAALAVYAAALWLGIRFVRIEV